MALKTLVASVNSRLKELESEMEAHKENPRMRGVVHELVRLTNSEEDNEKMEREAAEAASKVPQCPHEIVNRKTGKCVACGEVPAED